MMLPCLYQNKLMFQFKRMIAQTRLTSTLAALTMTDIQLGRHTAKADSEQYPSTRLHVRTTSTLCALQSAMLCCLQSNLIVS
jgi:hypothetical protein